MGSFGWRTEIATAILRTQIGSTDSMKVWPDHAASSARPIADPTASAASGGTALPMRSRHAESDSPSSSSVSSGQTRLCNAAHSSVVNGRCHVLSRARM